MHLHTTTAADASPEPIPSAPATAPAQPQPAVVQTTSLVPRSHSLRDTLRQASAAAPPRRERSRCARLLLAARELVDVLDPKYPHPHVHPQHTDSATTSSFEQQAQTLLSSAAIELAYVKSLSRLRYLLHRKRVQKQIDSKTRDIRALLAKILASPSSAAAPQSNLMAKHPLSREVGGSASTSTLLQHPADNRPLLGAASHSSSTKHTAKGHQDADKALSHVIALSNDAQFLESLRKDETCPVYALLDILEVRKSPFHLALAVEPTCPAEFYPDHLDQEEMDKRVKQIVSQPSCASTAVGATPASPLAQPASSVFDDPPTDTTAVTAMANPNRLSGIFDAVIHQAEQQRSGTPVDTMPQHHPPAWPRVGPNGQPLPSLSRFTTVAKIMESNFGPNATSGNSSPVQGSFDVPKPRSRTVNDSGTFAGQESEPGSLMRRPQSVPPKPTLATNQPFTADPEEQDSMPAPAAVVTSPKPLGRSPNGSGVFAEPRYPSLERNVMVLPSPTRAAADPELGSHFESCPVCNLVKDYSYTKYIQLAVLYHENNDLEQSYHCLQHAVDVANSEECPMPTPYFLTALYLRHGWGVETHLADSFRLLLLSLEYAIKHVLAMQLSASDRPTSADSATPDPASAPFLLTPTGPSKKRTPIQEYMATYRDHALPYDPSAIHGSPARMGVAMILYEVAVSLRYGWGSRGNSKLAKALVVVAANLGDVQACVEVGTRLARRAHRVSPVAAITGDRKRKARARVGWVRDPLVGWALNEKYDAVMTSTHAS
ncbi:hypothetical protein BCR44DRAFT_1424730 [Catenaria anguillulae PL171]|uniref:Uncharacterized protein n=1 Tax=Catenaria anguillulae PL171 TaxID=765915 RepID=A0A1Y2I218_9FUNG|nr:hypothetical protein BCR44DRAFT_1424730 [Catenaria anguillulae PL171]